MAETKLEIARKMINEVDAQMAELFCRRMEAARLVAEHKQERGLPILDPAREAAVIERNAQRIENEEFRSFYISFLQDTMKISRSYQAKLMEGQRIAYNGVEGAFAHIAAGRIFPSGQKIAYGSFEEAYRSVERGECDCAVLPIENSTAGEVGQVIDLLFSGSLHVNAVYDLSVRHNLLTLPGTDLKEIKEVVSHPQALAQCSVYLQKHGFATISSTSTANAAKQVAESGKKSVAAIASAETAKLYQLEILQENINETTSNATRFAVVSRIGNQGTQGNSDRTILFFSVRHQVGCLAKAIDIISKYQFNMITLRSRPVREIPWQYYFHVEIEGNLHDENGKNMLAELAEVCDTLKVAGTFHNDVRLDETEEATV